MFVDYVLNGQGRGGIGEVLEGCRFDPGLLRPFIETHPNHPYRGRPCVNVNTGKMLFNHKTDRYEPQRKTCLIADLQARGINSPVFNATSLRKEDWILFDRKIVRAARERLRAVADLAASATFGGFDGMSKMTIEYEAMSDPGEALVDMDGMTEGRNDSPLFSLRSMPLPITHSDFFFSQRRISVSRNSGTPLDTVMAEAAGRRVAEMLERTAIGLETGVTYGTQSSGVGTHTGTSTIYGYLNFPYRLTKTNFTAPTTTNGPTTYAEVLAALSQLYANKHYGPFIIYHSVDWTQYMNSPFSTSGGNNPGETLRTMLLKNPDVVDVRRLDLLTSTYTLIFVEMSSETAEWVNGMDITTLQWESVGGMRQNFKVMAIQAPRLRYDYAGNVGVLHGTTA